MNACTNHSNRINKHKKRSTTPGCHNPTLQHNNEHSNQIRRVERDGTGYRMTNKSLKILYEVDDAPLIAEGEDDLQSLLFRFKQNAEPYNMTLYRR